MSEPSVDQPAEQRIQIDQNNRVFHTNAISLDNLFPAPRFNDSNFEFLIQVHDHAERARVNDSNFEFLQQVHQQVHDLAERAARSYRVPFQYNAARQAYNDYSLYTEFFDPVNVDKYFTNIKSLDEYDIEDCTNIQELKEDVEYSCSICLGIFDTPHKLSCNHTFCKKCIDKINNFMCPLCRKGFSYFFKSEDNKELAKEIEKIQIKCSKCNKNHLIKENCDTKKICNYCNLHIDKNNLVHHLNICKIIKTCIHCNKYILAESYSSHILTCDKRIQICDNCHESVKYNMFYRHTCPSKIKCNSCHGMFPSDKHALHEIKCVEKMAKKNKKQEWNRRK